MREEREEERELCVLCVGKQATAQSNTKSWQQKKILSEVYRGMN